MREVVTKLYSYDELSDEAKKKAIDSFRNSQMWENIVSSMNQDDFDSLSAFLDSLDSLITWKGGDHYGSLFITWDFTDDWYNILDGEYDLEEVPLGSGDGYWLACVLREDWATRVAPINEYIQDGINGDEVDLNHLKNMLNSAIDDTVSEAEKEYNDAYNGYFDDEYIEQDIEGNDYEFTEDGELY